MKLSKTSTEQLEYNLSVAKERLCGMELDRHMIVISLALTGLHKPTDCPMLIQILSERAEDCKAFIRAVAMHGDGVEAYKEELGDLNADIANLKRFEKEKNHAKKNK